MADRIIQPSGSANNNYQPSASQMGAPPRPNRPPSYAGRPTLGSQGMKPPVGSPNMNRQPMGSPNMNRQPMGSPNMNRQPMGRPPMGGMRNPQMGRPPMGGMRNPQMGGQPMRNPQMGGMGNFQMGTTKSKQKISSETKWALLLLVLIVVWFRLIFSAPIIIHNATTPKEQLEQERLEKKEKVEQQHKYGDTSTERTKTKVPTDSKVY